jgi:pSer/pThr/pTyr-binding forkhead associated (FHA) protein
MDVKLVMFKADGERKDFPVTNEVTVVGRGEKCDLRVPLLSVSRRHCEVTVAGDEVKVKDLGSSNGTYVSNKRVTEATLGAGDRVVVGPVVFTIQIDGKPEEVQPPKVRAKSEDVEDDGEVEEVELEIAAAKSTPTTPDDIAAALEAGAGAEKPADIDPISALEALAAESDKKDE